MVHCSLQASLGWDDSKCLALISAYEPSSLARYQALAAGKAAGGQEQQQGSGSERCESQWLRKQSQVASALTLKVSQLLGISQAQLSLVALSC
jgi:hypothetical protein